MPPVPPDYSRGTGTENSDCVDSKCDKGSGGYHQKPQEAAQPRYTNDKANIQGGGCKGTQAAETALSHGARLIVAYPAFIFHM